MGSLAEWIGREDARRGPRRGALSALHLDCGGVSWHTVNRAKDGAKVTLGKAIAIHKATRHEVPLTELTNDPAAPTACPDCATKSVQKDDAA